MSEETELSANDLVNNIINRDYAAASNNFDDLIAQRIDDNLSQQKINMASQIFSDEEDTSVDDISDEELESEIESEIEDEIEDALSDEEENISSEEEY